MKPEGMSEERLTELLNRSDCWDVDELVAEVRRLQTLLYGKTVSLVTTIHGGQTATYEPSLAEQAASDREERTYWERAAVEARQERDSLASKLATAVDALRLFVKRGTYNDPIEYTRSAELALEALRKIERRIPQIVTADGKETGTR